MTHDPTQHRDAGPRAPGGGHEERITRDLEALRHASARNLPDVAHTVRRAMRDAHTREESPMSIERKLRRVRRRILVSSGLLILMGALIFLSVVAFINVEHLLLKIAIGFVYGFWTLFALQRMYSTIFAGHTTWRKTAALH